jgi:peptide/nickel transport system ATP-binding protein
MSDQPLLEVRDVHCSFERRRGLGGQSDRLRAVDGISLTVHAGETLGIVGESGSGKTTLARIILGLQRADDGTVIFKGEPILGTDAKTRSVRAYVQAVFQDPYASLDPTMRAREIVLEPIQTHLRLSRAAAGERIEEAFSEVGLSREYLGRYPHELSGGECQRVALARAIVLRPSLLVCDEPTSSLDVSVQSQVLILLRRLQQESGMSYIFISHNLAVVRHLSNRVAVMYLGKVVEVSPVASFFAQPLHPYSTALLVAVPAPDPSQRQRRLHLVEGDVPSVGARPAGCAFHPRCPIAQAVCRTETPPLAEHTDGRFVACHFPGQLTGPGIGDRLASPPAAEGNATPARGSPEAR